MPTVHLITISTSGNMNASRTSLGTEEPRRSLLKEDRAKAPMNSGSR